MNTHYPLSDLYLPNINVYTSQEDRTIRTGISSTGFSTTMPIKLWEDPSVPRTGQSVYNVVTLDAAGNPVITQITVANTEAGSVNIPPSQISASAAAPAVPPGVMPVPVRDLKPYEKLVRGPAGSILVLDTQMQALITTMARRMGVPGWVQE
jgi:hypothetical protein